MRRLNLSGWLFVVFVVGLVEVGVRLVELEDTVPAPSTTLRVLAPELTSGALSREIATTLTAFGEGLALAVAFGVVAGIAIGSSRTLLDATSVLIEFLRPIPAITFIPLAIMFFGLGIPMRRFVVAYAALWPILINTLYGVRGADRLLHDVARTSGVSAPARLVRVTLPAALPSIATGVRVSASIALLVAVTAEFLTGTGGIGAYMQKQQLAYQLPEMYAAIVVTASLGYVINLVIRAVERRVVFWSAEERLCDPVSHQRLNRVGGRLLGIAVFLAAIAVWEAWARIQPSFLFPPASTVAERAWEVWPTSDFLTTVAASLKRLAAGYAIGAGIGIAVGVSIGASRRIRRMLDPLVEMLRATPPIAIVPAAIVIFGLDDLMRITVIAFGVSFPVLVNSLDGVRAVSPEARDTASLLHLGRADRSLRIYLPAALPSIFAGLRVALAIGLVMVVLSEFVGGQDGIGHYIIFQQSQFNVPEVYAGIVFLGVLGYVLNRLFLLVESYALAWHRGAAGDPAR